LRFEGYDVAVAADGSEALAAIAEHDPDVVVLDVMMPSMSGTEVCRVLRAAGDRTPVLLLTARDAVRDRVAGLDAGADDYLVKPFAADELLARLRALLRRGATDVVRECIEVGPLRLLPSAREAIVDGRPVRLTGREFCLLETLARDADRVLSRAHLYDVVWQGDLDTASNALEVYVGYVRRKLAAARPGTQALLETVRGAGYVLRSAPPAPSSAPSSAATKQAMTKQAMTRKAEGGTPTTAGVPR